VTSVLSVVNHSQKVADAMIIAARSNLARRTKQINGLD